MAEPTEGKPLAGAACGERRYTAVYCTPHAQVRGELCVTSSALHFAPHVDGLGGKDWHAAQHEVRVDMQDVIECGAIAMPLTERAGAGGGSGVIFFVQLHVSTLDGQAFRTKAESAEDPWRVLLRVETRDDLYEVARVILDASDAAQGGCQTGLVPRVGSQTSVPFSCLDCMAEIEAASVEPQSLVAKDSCSIGPSSAASSKKRPFAASALQKAWRAFSTGPSQSSSSSCSRGGRPGSAVASQMRQPGTIEAIALPERSPRACQVDRVVLRPGSTPADETLLTRSLAECILDFLPVSLRMPGAVEWVLRYTPKAHGVSLSTMYRNLADREKTILLVKDSQEFVFGGFAPEQWEPKGKFYGSGEAFVFSFTGVDDESPELQFYPWTSANSQFMYSDYDLIAMGGGDGRHALVVHNDLLRGLSSPTATFGNPYLAASEEFVVRDIELWALEACRGQLKQLMDISMPHSARAS